MKKVLFLLILSALLLLGGCGRERLPAEKAAAPVEAQNIAYSEPTEEASTEEASTENIFEGVHNGYIPNPDPVEPTVETAEK